MKHPTKSKFVLLSDEEREAFVRSLVGKEEFQLESSTSSVGATLRVGSEDGEQLIGTADYRIDRICVDLVGGKVVNAWIG
jgi:hypothetical protein